MTVAERLKAKRLELEMTLDQVASEAGITRQYLGYIESRKRKDPSFRIMARIAKVYGLNLATIEVWYNQQEEI